MKLWLFVCLVTVMAEIHAGPATDPASRPATPSASLPTTNAPATARVDAPPAVPSVLEATSHDFFLISAKYTNALTLAPAADDGRIAQTVGRVFERSHYSRHKFDVEVGKKMFDRFIDSLDPQRLYFLKTDLEEFDPVREHLDDLIMSKRDVQPAYDIFNRFLMRYDQAYSTVIDQLKNGTFDFSRDEKFLVNRKEAPRPATLDEARKLWVERLKFEYLSEKLDDGEVKGMVTGLRTNLLVLPRPVSLVGGPERGSLTNILEALTNKFGVEHGTALTRTLVEAYGNAIAHAPLKTNEVVDALLLPIKTEIESARPEAIVKKLVRRYQRTLRNLKQFESDEVLQIWLDSLGHAYDPHTDYLGKRELDQFAMGMNLRLFGIGATLTSEDGYTVIKEIRPGTPADKSKLLKVNDKIVGVAQGDKEMVDVVDEKLTKVVDQIRGKKGTEVRLAIIPSGADSSAKKIISIIRDEIKLEDAQAKAKLVEFPMDGSKTVRLGVIDLPSFYANFSVGDNKGSGTTTTGDVNKLLKKLTSEGVDGIILDLRRNGGGSLEEAINLTGLFIKSGPVVQVRNPDGSVQVDNDVDESVAYDGPLMVLTSRFSASASEILAAALQDYGRAVIVGDVSTHGKGTVQTVQELNNFMRGVENPGAVKVTIRKFYRANGGSTQLKGVTPDLVLPSLNNYAEVGEGSLENALAYDTIAKANFERLNRIQPYLPELQKRSSTRLSTDKDYAYLQEDIDRYRKALAEKAISLNETDRRRERDELKAKARARKKELLARREVPPTTYEISLKQAGQSGLPPAMTNKPPVLSTESIDAADPAEVRVDPEDEELDEPVTAVDIHLKEAERILIDLIRLSSSKSGVAVTR